MTHSESHPLSNGGLTCHCCRDLYFCTICNDDIVRVNPNKKEYKNDIDELLKAINSVAEQQPCETVGHWSCANALRSVVELAKTYSEMESYVNEEFYQGSKTAFRLVIDYIKKELDDKAQI